MCRVFDTRSAIDQTSKPVAPVTPCIVHQSLEPLGATACIVVHSFLPYYERTGHWQALAWWVHDNVPGNAGLTFFPKLAAFNISWHEKRERSIYSYASPKG